MTDNVVDIKAYKNNLKAKKNKNLLIKILMGLGFIMLIPAILLVLILSLAIIIMNNLGKMVFGIICDMHILLVDMKDNICDFYKEWW